LSCFKPEQIGLFKAGCPRHISGMHFGRLIRVRAHRSDAEAAIYVVAEPDVEKAISDRRRFCKIYYEWVLENTDMQLKPMPKEGSRAKILHKNIITDTRVI
jgi:hypothetical protein